MPMFIFVSDGNQTQGDWQNSIPAIKNTKVYPLIANPNDNFIAQAKFVNWSAPLKVIGKKTSAIKNWN